MGLPLFRFTLKHKLQTEAIEFSNNSFDVSISGWTQISSGSDISFSWAATSSARASGAAPDTTAIGQQRPDNPTEGWPPGDYRVSISATNNSTGGSSPFQSFLQIYGSGNGTVLNTSVSYNGNGYWDVGAGKVTNVISFTLTDYQQYLFFKFQKAGSGTGFNVDFRVDVIEIVYANVVVRHQQITEPDGWKDAKLILERHPDYHSPVEYFDGSFIFYGNNGIDDGGIDFIKNIEKTYGVDANIILLAEVSFDEVVYETVFEGLLDLSDLQEVKDNKMEVPVIRETAWTKFIARRDTPVDLRSTTDLDGNPVDAVEFINVNLSSQIVRQKYEAYQEQFSSIGYTINTYAIIDFAQETLSEINDKFTLPRVESTTQPSALFTLEFAGSYNFNIRIATTTLSVLGSATDTRLVVKLAVNNVVITTLTQTTTGTPALDGKRIHTYNGILSLNKNDTVSLYFESTIGAPYTFVWPANVLSDSHLILTADTIYPSSSGEGFLLHDAFAGVIQRIIGRNAFYSLILGGTQTNRRTYASNGCYWANVLIKGLQLRNYNLSTKPFFVSFNDLWEGSNPILNLSLGYDTVAGENVIRIEEHSYWFSTSSRAVDLANIREITREYDKDKIYKKIDIGYSKWQSEDISGIDDPQTKHTYSTRFEKIGRDISLHSKFIAASLAIEVTRRKTLKKTEDYKFDNDTFIIALNSDDVSPDRYQPELSENFDSVTGLIRPETRYNLIHTPLRMFLRWANVFNGALQKYLTSSYIFTAGEGNYDMVSDYSCSRGQECLAKICDSLSEKQNISLASYGGVLGFIHYSDKYDISIDLSWDEWLLIRNNRRLCNGLSQTDTNFKRFFHYKLEFELCKSKLKATYEPQEIFELGIIESVQPCPPGGCGFGFRDSDVNCNQIHYRAAFDTTMDGWANEDSATIAVPTLQALSGWVNTSTGNLPWLTGANPFVDTGGGTPESEYLKGTFAAVGGITYNFLYALTIGNSAFAINVNVEFYFLDSSNNVLASAVLNYTSSGAKSGSVNLTSSTNVTYLAMRFINHGAYPVFTQSVTVTSVTSNNSPVAIPSWAWNSAYGGSIKAQTLYKGYGVKNVIKASITLPDPNDCRIRIMYAVTSNVSDVSLRLVIKDSGGVTLRSTVFASDITSTTEQTADIDIADPTVIADADNYQILLESDSFLIGDVVYITDVTVLQCIDIFDPDICLYDTDYCAILQKGNDLGYSLPSTGQQVKQNQLVLDLKAAGLWTGLDILYVFATDGDSDFATINWKDPDNFQITKNLLPTFTPNIGFQGATGVINTTPWLDTQWAPSVGVNFTLNAASAFCYINNEYTDGGIIFGASGSAGAGQTLLAAKASSTHQFDVNGGGGAAKGSSVSSIGFFQVQRRASNDLRIFKNGSQVGTTSTSAPNGRTSATISIFGQHINTTSRINPCDGQIGVFGAGASLSGSESALYTCWNDYFTSL